MTGNRRRQDHSDSATVVAVVVFLCGVMVGRGVAVPRTVAAADIGEQAILDPTAGMGCDDRYVPFVASEDGTMPMVYASAVTITPRKEQPAAAPSGKSK